MSTVILSTEHYSIQSFHNGLAYEMRHRAGDGVLYSFYVQGDDAREFGDALEAAYAQFPDYEPAQICDHLWDRLGYADAASPHVPFTFGDNRTGWSGLT